MKRNNRGNPIQVTHRWNRPSSSCLPCRVKKRRCDRAQPCSNCVLRSIPCNYAGQSPEIPGPQGVSQLPRGVHPAKSAEVDKHNVEELLQRIRRLEDGLADKQVLSHHADLERQGVFKNFTSTSKVALGSHFVKPFNQHPPSYSNLYEHTQYPSIIDMTRELPPLRQANHLFDNFVRVLQPTLGVLHIPSTRILMERTYQCLLEGEEPPPADLMLVFAVFAGAALVWTPQLLEKLNATQWEAKSAFMAYARLALAILDHPRQTLKSSTTALVAIGTMAHLLMNTDGFPLKVHVLRHRCLLMSKDLGIHRLDTAKSREERRLKGCDMIEVEVQRRIWWWMVASDWLLSFSGGPQEGAYTFQPKHMNVNLPSNTDDEYITSTEVKQDLPLSEPTNISAFFFRVKSSELCREVIDALPSILLDSQEPTYDTILQLDKRFHDLLDSVPTFFKLDPDSIRQSQAICKERPHITWQRIGLHFSIHTRLCRLHRPYHLEGVTTAKYAYSHSVCIRSAHKILELRRTMDEVDSEVGLKPARFWTVMHHVFFAALILAMDVSFNPPSTGRPCSESQASGLGGSQTVHAGESSGFVQPSSSLPGDSALGFGLINDMGEESWENLWSEFVAVAPDLEAPQWNALLDDVDFTSQLDIY
ncbi:uncharacterized protein N7477_000524 [Penicillium maclennaniae]|uniref:uncharacterized protein n=1 Tax=Penicillium maclennaniae TaxID=1343394 RepID=UPI0025426873|nr:uncharacterized protein N7477_000524 [Penicillium maclennaniae]KAJ5684179.1 hypothetical protein N7477_000524 [Penicillium maclennaniae]